MLRSFLVAFTEPPEEDDPRLPATFGPATAAPPHLLDARLATGPPD